MKILDFYFQIGIDHWTHENRPAFQSESTYEGFKQLRLDLAKHDHQYEGAVIFPPPSAPAADFDAANEVVFETACSDNFAAENLFPIYAVKPRCAKSVAWLRAALEQGKPCVGIKLWPYMGGFSLTDLLVDRELVDLVQDYRLLVHMHVGTGREAAARPAFKAVAADPAAALEVAVQLPQVKFIMSHLLRLSKRSLELAAGLGNVYLDTSGLSSLGAWKEGGRDGLPANDSGDLLDKSSGEILRYLAETLGFESRLLFGSNWPFCTWWNSNLLREISTITESSISDAAKNDVLMNNAKRLLGQIGHSARRVQRQLTAVDL